MFLKRVRDDVLSIFISLNALSRFFKLFLWNRLNMKIVKLFFPFLIYLFGFQLFLIFISGAKEFNCYEMK